VSFLAAGRPPWSGRLLLTNDLWLAGFAVVLAGLLFAGIRYLDQLPRPLPAPASMRAPEPVSGPSHRHIFYANSSRAVPGIKYAMTLPTHCGVGYPNGPDFDGSLWDPTWTNFAFGNQPSGTSGPTDSGYIVLVSADTAEFHSSEGFTFRFSRHTGPRIAGDCM
jgi:hypothetical protein